MNVRQELGQFVVKHFDSLDFRFKVIFCSPDIYLIWASTFLKYKINNESSWMLCMWMVHRPFLTTIPLERIGL